MKAAMSDAPILPEELVADVLSRLPVKSLCRFKCVSHSWYSLISDPHFALTHNTRNYKNNTMPERLILISVSHALFSVDYSADVPVATKLDFPSFPFESYNVWSEILGSCYGLILARNKATNINYLLNPSTRESMFLPKSPFALDWVRPHHLYGLGYDWSTDDYKVVMLSYYGRTTSNEESEGTTTDTNTNVSVYSVDDDSWRSIQGGSSYAHAADNSLSSGGVYVNGGLHWLASSSRSSDSVSLIVAFDLAEESFLEVPPPTTVVFDRFLWCSLVVVGKCLCFLTSDNYEQVVVWMMKEYGVKESWTKFAIWGTHIFAMELVSLLEGGEFLLAMDEKKLVVYDPKGETKRDILVCGIPTMFTKTGTYVESIVSPDYGNGIVTRFKSLGERMKRILPAVVEAHEAKTEQSSTNKDSYRVEPSSSSKSISASASASASSSIDDPFSLLRCLDLLESFQIVEGPVYEKALRMFEEQLWRELFITALYSKMF